MAWDYLNSHRPSPLSFLLLYFLERIFVSSVRIFPNPDALAEAMALRFRKEAKQAARENRIYSLVLTGGATAAKIYRLFAVPRFGGEIPWESVHLFWTDERCVSPESNESNFGMAHRMFLHAVSIPDENIHRIRGEENPVTAANRYACEIQNHMVLKGDPSCCFDWVFMGLGMDGHTASIFPGQEALLSASDLCGVARHAETGQNRITLTGSAFQQAARITYHVIGSDKAGITSELVSESPESKKFPAAHISGEWYLDQAAASSLETL
jgi:6-phosphogluconolactonase